MSESLLTAVIRTLADGPLSRRRLALGAAGAALAVPLLPAGITDMEAKKRKKGKKGKKRKKRNRRKQGNGGNGGGNRGNVGAPCPGTICGGQCVDLDTDPNHCGACNLDCNGNACVGGFCVEIIGSRGNGEGQFEDPIGIALTKDGNALVTDNGNGRVVILGGGEFGNVNFGQPVAIAANQNNGDVYVSDFASHSVTRFAANGDVLKKFGSFGSGDQQFEFPFGIAVDPTGEGQLFITDTGNNRIKRTTLNGFEVGSFGRGGSGPGEFNQPQGIALSADRVVFVADTENHRVQVFNIGGNFIRAFGTRGSGPGQFELPVAIAFAPDGTVFVVDQGNNRVQQFTPEGQFLKAIGSAGSGPGQFNGPSGIAFDGDIFGVVDTGNHRIQAFFPGNSDLTSASLLTSGRRGSRAANPRRRQQRRGRGRR